MINIETLFFEDFCNRIWPSASDSTIPVEISCSLCRILNWARGSFHSSSGKSMAFGVRLSVVPASAHPSKPYLPPQVSVTSVQAPNIVATAFGILDHGLSGMLNDADTFFHSCWSWCWCSCMPMDVDGDLTGFSVMHSGTFFGWNLPVPFFNTCNDAGDREHQIWSACQLRSPWSCYLYWMII